MTAAMFRAVAETAQDLIGSEEVAVAWDEPSALVGYTVGGLAGHLARAILTVETYLDAPPPPVDATPSDAAGYFATVLGGHDPVDSDLHRSVRAKSREAAARGPEALAADVRRTRHRLEPRLGDEPQQRLLAVRDGVAMPLEEYLRTRLVELVVHIDDLAVSVGRNDGHSLPPGAFEEVATVLARLATRRVGGLTTVRGLARRERQPGGVTAL